jgi:ferredoxin-NADP reductase
MPQKLRCQVTEILDHGDQVYSVFLKPETLVPRFLPGQFLHLALDEYSPGDFWPDSRSFSIASATADRELLRITYAVKGQFTHRMEADLKPGRDVWVKMPYGDFIVDAKKDACLLAGGTGVTAFTAFLAGLSLDYPQFVYLFYGARCPDLLIYRSLVTASRDRCPNLKVWFLAEQDAGKEGYILGRVDAATVFRSVTSPLTLNYYLAGPPEMINGVTVGLRQLGVTSDHLIADAWE